MSFNASVRNEWTTGSGLDFEDDFQFDRRTKRRTRDAKDRIRRDGLVIEHFSQQFRCRIGEFRVAGGANGTIKSG
jgi:hypothetical protein